MSLTLAQRSAFNLAKTLMAPVILFKTGSDFGVILSAEFDGDADTIICEYDPFA